MPQIRFLAFITLISAVLFLAMSLIRGKMHELKIRKHWWELTLYTLLIAVIPYGLITYATRYSSGINTTIFTQSEMIFAALIGCWLLKEKMNRARVLGIICILAANMTILFKGNLETSWADWVLLLAPAIFVYGNIIAKRLMDHIDWSTILTFRTVVGGMILLLVSIGMEGPGLPPQELWFFLIWFSLLTFGVAKIFWQLALKRLDVSKITALAMTYPALSFIFAYFWLGEVPNSYQWGGIVFTILGIVFLMQSPSKQYEDDF